MSTGLSGEPLGYFLTWTCYGTWLHGDPRGSVDRATNAFDSPTVGPNSSRLAYERTYLLKHPPFVLDAHGRAVVDETVRLVCSRRGWELLALNVRTNHVHAVVAGADAPERILGAFKAWATRSLVAEPVVTPGTKVWTRHGSTRYLWTERDVKGACRYVTEGQGPALPMGR